MSFIDLFDFYASQHDGSDPVPINELPATPPRKDTSKGTLEDGPHSDSVTKRRRHAVYMERPPVWLLSPDPPFNDQDLSGGYDDILCGRCGNSMRQSPGKCSAGVCPRDFAQDTDARGIAGEETTDEQEVSKRELLCDIAAAVAEAQATEADSNSDPETPLLSPFSEPTKRQCDYFFAANDQSDSPNSSEEDLPNHLQSPLRQSKAGLCTRLHSYRDIRLEVGEKWAIQEGSLVVCLDPSYTQFIRQEKLPDAFDITTGDFYIVCSLYADLWALCLKLSFERLADDDKDETLAECSTHLGFLPLCAVTLAANFSSFIRRCQSVNGTPRYPGNGLPVMPPERSHSLNASKQFFQGDRLHIGLSSTVYDTYNTLSLEAIDMDFIPLDSTLQQLFSSIRGRRDRVQKLGKHRVQIPSPSPSPSESEAQEDQNISNVDRDVMGVTSQGRPPRVSRRRRSEHAPTWQRAQAHQHHGTTGSKYRSTSRH
ncbi:hypothetical protein SI65_01801 [Aspergillus cristatus]|uniref:Uncharacterized protein n=1 Tax=Aspergillus cristatus TaxID=573508 RepID=A0A1E3BTW4_ASPCR|nr:hypothetical protein SI65_01801 [Aspergillus cristatus]